MIFKYKKEKETYKKAWVIAVNMGYGHERPAHSLESIAQDDQYIVANNYPGISKEEKEAWRDSRKLYEAVSRLKPIPIIGDIAFGIMDRIQEIEDFYPRRDLSTPNLQLKETIKFIKKHEICKKLIDDLAEHKKHLPLVCTFFIPAFAAEIYDYPGEIYVCITDTDFSRTWVAEDPKRSRIKYLAPSGRVVERLKLYGVNEKNIYLTGFPLPKNLIGGPDSPITKDDMMDRINNLDPNGIFKNRYYNIMQGHFGTKRLKQKTKRPLTLSFAVGGAGAQRYLGIKIIKSLKEKIRRHHIQINLIAGTHKNLKTFFEKEVKKLGIKTTHSSGVNIIFENTRPAYFTAFNKMLRETDILWTKPSELSFYTGLGIPIVMAEPIGSQEKFNRLWLQQIGGGIDQLDPEYTDEWLFDWIDSGALARMAWNGYIEAPTHGTYRIEQIITGQKIELEQLPLVV